MPYRKVRCLTPHHSHDAHGNTMEHQSSHAWMAMRKGRLQQRQRAWKKSESPHHSNDGSDDPIVPYRPLLHRTNLHADLPPLSAMSSARRASSQACVSLTGGLVYLNVLVYDMLCGSPMLLKFFSHRLRGRRMDTRVGTFGIFQTSSPVLAFG